MARDDSAAAGAQASDNIAAGVQPSGSAEAGAQPSDDGGRSQITRSDLVNHWFWSFKRLSALTGEVLTKLEFDWQACARISGILIILIHLILLAAYGTLGLLSRDEHNYSSIFVYGGSIITFISYVVLYCTNINKLTSSIFERGQGESMGTHWAKAGLMGIVLPVFNFIGLIVLFTKGGQDDKTFRLGIAAFSFYFLGNTILFFGRGKHTESEEHEIRENNPPVANSQVDDSPVDNLPVDNSPAVNSAAANSPVDNSSVDNSPRPSIRTFP
ncbi:uncharacterized protein ZBIST_5132 [Zygosaccharomyces bailii]|nr:uncharacterized protein ZBIST_5132 [Zygosaccharomyces bailii]